jgi:hypothetical protein
VNLRPTSTILWAASAYALLVTGLYLFGYWGRFGLNVLEYIGIGDMVSHALMPFLASIISLVFAFTLSTISQPQRPLPAPTEVAKAIRFVQTYWRTLTIVDLMAVAAVIGYCPEPERWFLAMILILPLILIPTNSQIVIDLLPNPTLRFWVVWVFFVVTALAFAEGRTQADHLLRGEGPLLVDVGGSGLQLKSDAAHPVSYVGHIADFFVLYDSAQSQIIILNAQKVNSLTLIQNPKAADDVL